MNTLYINGEPYNTQSTWSISEKSGNPSSSSFTVMLADRQRIPQNNDLVEFKSGSTTLFRGTCGIPKGQSYSSGNELPIYSLSCNSLNNILARRLPNVSYENKTLSFIVNKLYEEYIQAEGFTLGRIEVTNEPTFEIYNSNQIALSKLLNELAEYVNAVWEITCDKVFNFYSAQEHPIGNVVLSEDNAGLSGLSQTEENNQVRTRQIIEGAIAKTSAQTEEFIKTDDVSTFLTVYPLAEQPVIRINGVTVSSSEIAVKNLAAESETVLFFWTYNSENISINPSYTGSTTVPTGATITVIYFGIVDIRVEVDNTVKMEELAQKTGTTGIIENYYSDKDLQTPEDAYSKANALLLAHGEEKRTLSADTTTEILMQCGFTFADTAIGTLWTFNLPRLGIEGDYVVTERKIKQNILSDDGSYCITLKWADKDYSGGYAKTLSDLETAQTKLQVRKNLQIIKYINSEEKTTLDEDLTITADIPQFCGEGIYNGQIAIPCGTLYPWVTGV